MLLRIERRPSAAGTPGDLTVDGAPQCVTLERALSDPEHPAIPAASYEVALTYSPAAASGHLWTPREDFRLLEVRDVPGRTGIRIHAANRVLQLLGCIAVGTARSEVPNEIIGSRDALTALMALVGEGCDMEIVNT